MRAYFPVVIAAVLGVGVTVQGQGRQVFPGGGTMPFAAATKADGLIYVSGTIAAQGDIKAQTKAVLDNIGQTLAKAGSSLANVVAVQVYVKNAADVAGMTEVWRQQWPKDAPTRTTVLADLVVPNGLVEMSMIAVPNGGERVIVTPEGWSTANPYSYAIRSGDTLFMSGLVSRDARTNQVMTGDIGAQTKAIFANAAELLKTAGFGLDNIVASRVFLSDVANFQGMNQAYVPNFPTAPPARATVVVGLPGADYLVEMTFTAVKGAKQAFATPNADGTPGRASATLSSAIKVGNRLYVSGILGNNQTNKGDVGAQTTELLARVERTMKAAGFAWTDVVDAVAYLTDLNNFNGMNAAYRVPFGDQFPARATVKTGLVGADGLIEIMFTAAK